MRISEIYTQLQVKKYSNAERLNDTSVQPVASRSDKVELSSEARGILDGMKAAREADSVDPRRIEDLAQRIRKGTYSVSAAQVADRMLGKSEDAT